MRKLYSQEVLRRLISVGIRHAYARNYQSTGYKEYVLPNQSLPGILAPDHQNAFLDTLVMVTALDRPFIPITMARSDIFVKPVIPFLNWLRLRPVYRRRDGIVDVKTANQAGFSAIVEELSKGERMSIFPEGNHGRKRRLRPLKKGFARIGFQAEEANDFSLGLLVYPVGITFWEHLFPGTDILVKFGEPIRVSDYREMFEQNPDRAYLALKEALADRMRALIHHIEEGPGYETIDRVRDWVGPAVLIDQGKDPDDLNLRLQEEQEAIELMQDHARQDDEAWKSFVRATQAYHNQLEASRLTDREVHADESDLRKMSLSTVGLAIAWPVYAVGYVGNGLPYWISDYAAVRLFKDDHFHASVRFAGTLVLQPLYWLIIFAAMWGMLANGWLALAGLVLWICLAWGALKYRRALKRLRYRWRWFRLSAEEKLQLRNLRKTWSEQLRAWAAEGKRTGINNRINTDTDVQPR